MVHCVQTKIASLAKDFFGSVGECKGSVLSNRACAAVSFAARLKGRRMLRQGARTLFSIQHSRLGLGLTKDVARLNSVTIQEVSLTLGAGGTRLRSRPQWHGKTALESALPLAQHHQAPPGTKLVCSGIRRVQMTQMASPCTLR